MIEAVVGAEVGDRLTASAVECMHGVALHREEVVAVGCLVVVVSLGDIRVADKAGTVVDRHEVGQVEDILDWAGEVQSGEPVVVDLEVESKA